MIKKIDRVTLRVLRDEINEVVQAVAKKHGIQITAGHGVYGDAFGSLKLDIATVGQDGVVNTREADDFKQYATLVNLKPEDFGKTFTSNGSSFKIVGLKLRSKYAVIAERLPRVIGEKSDGKRFKFPADAIRVKLGHVRASVLAMEQTGKAS